MKRISTGITSLDKLFGADRDGHERYGMAPSVILIYGDHNSGKTSVLRDIVRHTEGVCYAVKNSTKKMTEAIKMLPKLKLATVVAIDDFPTPTKRYVDKTVESLYSIAMKTGKSIILSVLDEPYEETKHNVSVMMFLRRYSQSSWSLNTQIHSLTVRKNRFGPVGSTLFRCFDGYSVDWL